ncbi:MAG TPA: type I polyketide synthase, partial [Pyrinomonadaceae bacterium]
MNNPDSFEHLGQIAVVGMALRFPGARDHAEFWRNLRGGVESVAFFSDEELAAEGVPAELLRNPKYVKANGLLPDVDMFDAAFFGVNPKEARLTDPQHRLLLECAWAALEDAGYDSERYEGRAGVYVSESFNTYFLFNLLPNRELLQSVGMVQTALGNDRDFLATRLSFNLNLRGPSVVVQSACSSSLVAIHLASQSLVYGECDMAVAGGVSVSLPQRSGYFYQEGGINSPDGHCRPFDARAQGTVGGNGVGLVVLKRLDDALAAGDHVYAVIKGSAVNNDGAVKIGYTAPSIEGQARVIAEALGVARVDPSTVTYVEAHGTATPLGDPIELAALTQAFRDSTDEKGFCAVGSVKSNFGHLDAAAGVAGLIKTVLALRNKELPPSLHFERPNPQIDFENSPFYVNAELKPWETRGGAPRRAGVSSFGIGGTNAHVVLEEAPARTSGTTARPWQLLVLSAQTRTALERATDNLVAALRENADVNLADVAYTLQTGRRGFAHRRMLVCRDVGDAVAALAARDPQRVFDGHAEGARGVAFMFPGQGAQYVNMGRELYNVEPEFRAALDKCAELLRPHLGLDVREVLFADGGRVEEAARQLHETRLTQPALFAVEYALTRMWLSWGVEPEALVGHSLGEYVAACVSGVLTLEDALRLVAARGRLMQEAPAGAMLSVALGEAEVAPLLGDSLSLAAVNSARQCVVAGDGARVEVLRRELSERGVACRVLQTRHAFHSELMDGMLAEFRDAVVGASFGEPQIPYVSNVTGQWASAAEVQEADYWVRQLRGTVRFDAGLRTLTAGDERVLLEVGPGQTLSNLARRLGPGAHAHTALPTLKTERDSAGDADFLLTTAGRLWLAGVKLDWQRFHEGERRLRLPLPAYPF